MIERITVNVNTGTLNQDDVEMLASYVKENKGNTALQMVFIDATNPHNQIRMTSRKHRVKVTRQFLDDIENSDALSYTINQ